MSQKKEGINCQQAPSGPEKREFTGHVGVKLKKSFE
jgi:hypothetical protein